MPKFEQNNDEFQTPMMQQYMGIKERYPDCLLLFRLGDFYEMFLEDAKVGARILDITLTSRSRGKDGKIPMAGVPYHALDPYLSKLVRAGHKVAICEQLSDPNEPGLVERDVVRIVTPGTLLDQRALDQKENSFAISISVGNGIVGIAAADISTGAFYVLEKKTQDTEKTMIDEISKYDPKECILPEELYNDAKILKILKKYLNTEIFLHKIRHKNSEKYLQEHFKVKNLESFGINGLNQAIEAAGTLLDYLQYTQKEKIEHMKEISLAHTNDILLLDRPTIRNLELMETLRNNRKEGSLLKVIDKTQTPMGGRLLKNWLLQPLFDKELICKRHDAVEELLKSKDLRDKMENILKETGDIERTLSRLALGMGNPRDLINLKNALENCLITKQHLKNAKTAYLIEVGDSIKRPLQDVISKIEGTIKDDPPVDAKQGGIIKENVNLELDKLRGTIRGSKKWLAELEAIEKQRTEISSLKVRFNKVFGFYIEISKSYLSQVPEHYIRKQTLVNAERFITPELKKHEEIILTAEETINALEYNIFMRVVENVIENTQSIQEAAKNIAKLDVLVSFAKLAETERYIKPEMTDNGEISIKNGRHPVVEQMLEELEFVPNDIHLTNGETSQLLIITGPNMAGKSVYIRQTALITLLAHMGSFVPAEEATISLTDKIFVRSGAADVITSGLSTFMVEMVETANILNNATHNSLIVMDEIGRGTSTYDGISIAWAVAEHLVTDKKTGFPKTLFATHYHELEELEKHFPGKVKNYRVNVVEHNGEPIFVHKVVPGGAGHSYGISVAKLAGLPENVTKKARNILTNLENNKKPKLEKVKSPYGKNNKTT